MGLAEAISGHDTTFDAVTAQPGFSGTGAAGTTGVGFVAAADAVVVTTEVVAGAAAVAG